MVTDNFSVTITSSKFVAMHMDSILKIDEYTIAVVNQEGLVKYDISFPKSEGAIVGYHKTNKVLAVFTNKCFVRLIDISKREIKTFGPTLRADEALHLENASIFDLKISHDGTKVLMIVTYPKKKADDKHLVVVWDIDKDSLAQYGLVEEPVSLAWEVSDAR
jgi:intraflagellar transport protein 140